VKLIRDYFDDREYARWFAQTDVLLLPYRRSSYGLRISRVLVEAMVHGKPVVVTRGTTLAEQADQFGAAAMCEDGNAESLVAAIDRVVNEIDQFKERAEARKAAARAHFSVREFRQLLVPRLAKYERSHNISQTPAS
jgi:glycosyltransferase involved in cell wall biosynthesis